MALAPALKPVRGGGVRRAAQADCVWIAGRFPLYTRLRSAYAMVRLAGREEDPDTRLAP